jgi:hypothetical protein
MDSTNIVPLIKFIGKIQKGEKINLRNMQLHQDTIITKFLRSFVYKDTRANTFTFIDGSIKKAFEILNMHVVSDKQIDKTICQNIMRDLRQCQYGMLNVKHTYSDDLMFCCKMDDLVENLIAKISDMESKYEYLRGIEIDS